MIVTKLLLINFYEDNQIYLDSKDFQLDEINKFIKKEFENI